MHCYRGVGSATPIKAVPKGLKIRKTIDPREKTFFPGDARTSPGKDDLMVARGVACETPIEMIILIKSHRDGHMVAMRSLCSDQAP